jgi:hypothetical protein
VNPLIRNILAVIAGVLVGSCVNMGLIKLGGVVVPPPPGTDVSTMEGLKAALPLFESKHFIFPFLAHALGTLVGAAVAAAVAATHKLRFALGIGVFYLVAGIAAVMMLPAPLWFNALDLVGAYLPMAWLGGKLAARTR